jgi:hypothetical protein
MNSVTFRRNEENIVRVKHYDPKVVRELCGADYVLDVYLEHCKARLDEFQDVPAPDSLYCAMAMLDGYEKLYRKVGRFYVDHNQVLIDESGKVRVWLNSDFA